MEDVDIFGQPIPGKKRKGRKAKGEPLDYYVYGNVKYVFSDGHKEGPLKPEQKAQLIDSGSLVPKQMKKKGGPRGRPKGSKNVGPPKRCDKWVDVNTGKEVIVVRRKEKKKVM